MPKKVIKWAVLGFVVFFVVARPTVAAHMVHSLGSGLGHTASGLVAFINSLAGTH
jgi:Na+-transporting NADH:ubiquinone oxidoreductase subunit NqrE